MTTAQPLITNGFQMQIKEFQGIISEKYEKRDRERGIPATFMWFVEEVGELATALSGNDQANKEEEFADVTITEDELWSEYDGKQPEGVLVIKDRIADIMFQQMLLRPDEYDVVATPNLNGDYLSDAVAAEVGGVGIAPGANVGDYVALFEATHGTAPKYTNLDKVNPGSLLFSGVMMLRYMGWREAADMIVSAYEKAVSQKVVTYDFARLMEGAKEVKTSEFASAVIGKL